MELTRRFEGVTPEKMQHLKDGLARRGIQAPDGNNGHIETMGIRLTVNYIAAEQALEVSIVEKPPFIPEELIWSQVEAPLRD